MAREDMPPRMKRFLERPPRRLSETAVQKRRAKGSRIYPSTWLTVCCDNQGWRCHYCGTLMRRKPGKGEAHLLATIDHVLALSRGGKNVRSNIVAACVRCNQEKGSMLASEYHEIWRKRRDEYWKERVEWIRTS